MYGDAEDEEHIKLARVLQILLNFSPQDVAKVDEQIEYVLHLLVVAPHRQPSEAGRALDPLGADVRHVMRRLRRLIACIHACHWVVHQS